MGFRSTLRSIYSKVKKSFTRKTSAGRPKLAVPDYNTQSPAATGSATSTLTPKDDISHNTPEKVSSEGATSHDAPEDPEAKPQSSPADLIESGDVENECAFIPAPETVATELGLPDRSPKPAASPTTCERVPTSPSTPGSAEATGLLPVSIAAPRSPQKKALLIGLNYKQCSKELRLRHATDDSRRFAAALTKLEYTSENMRVVTDEEGQSPASCEYLLECMDWLIDGASEGDRLFFMFSGHCLFPNGHNEPYLVAADEKSIPRSIFQERLVSKVPAGAELSIVLDCCHAAGMVKLKYRIGQMVPEVPASPICSVPHHGSLHGLENVGPRPALSLQTTPMINQVPFGTPTSTLSRRVIRGGVAAAQPQPVTPNQEPAAAPIALPTGAQRQLGPAERRQPVVQGRSIPQFQERKDGFVTPAGKVIVWAGTGERLKAFEASGGVESGIITNAFCSILDKCHEGTETVTRRDLWKSLVDAVGDENRCRRERDAKKPNFRNIPINTRLQLAELWVSQKEPLSSPSPFLNQVVECPWKN
ncbi:Ca(2+)-dependent cysteine protease [Ceratobasidium sp. 423]|nr:Ca(2+)-dependent cysteine protease [Ceratobasidium sp. 423]